MPNFIYEILLLLGTYQSHKLPGRKPIFSHITGAKTYVIIQIIGTKT
jgi:hypothetical protein